MGIWDAVVSSTTDSLKKRLPDTETVKDAGRNAYSVVADKLTSGAPDLRTPVAAILQSSYNHGCSALSTVVRAKGVQRVKESMPDKEALVRIGWNLTDIALDKYTRIYTGGLPVYRTLMEGLLKKDVKSAQNVKAEELEGIWNRMERLEAMLAARGPQPPTYPHRRMAGLPQKPEDVIRIFMMKGFTGGNFLDDQVIPQHGNWRRDVLLCPVLPHNKFSGIFDV